MQSQLASQLDTMGCIYITSYNHLRVTVKVMCIYYKISSIRKDLFPDQIQVYNWISTYKTHEHYNSIILIKLNLNGIIYKR